MSTDEMQNFLVEVPEAIAKEKIAKLPLRHIKGISEESRENLEKVLGVKNIADFADKILTTSYVSLLKLLNITENDLEKWQAVASYVVKLVKGKVDLDLRMKVLLAGLHNAGKTAILNMITKKFNLFNLKPTVDVSVSNVKTGELTFTIWDMGGQDKYRANYISNPDRYFINVYTVIYVIDMQDKANYEPAMEYLGRIAEILETFQEYPEFYIFLHKADPNLYEKMQEYLKSIETRIRAVFDKRNFRYHIMHTSIFNATATEPNFSEGLMEIFDLSKRKKISAELAEGIQALYDNFIGLSYVVEEKFAKFDSQFKSLEAQIQQLMQKNNKEPQRQEIAPPISQTTQFGGPKKSSPPTPAGGPSISPQTALTTELKLLFKKIRRE